MTDDREDIHTTGIPVICRSCEARHKGVCGALTPEQLTELSKHTKRTVEPRSSELMSAEVPVETFSNIIGGVVKLTKLMPDGREQIVGLQFAPDFLGRPFAENSNHTAETTTDVRLCSFPRKVLERLIDESPQLERKLHQQALMELDEAREWMLTLGRKSAIEKVASFLCLISNHIDPDREDDAGVVEFTLPLTRAEMAEFLGLTIETVSRQMTKLRKNGLIQMIDNRSIRITSLENLEALAGNVA